MKSAFQTKDILAGLSVAGLLLPEAVAYAGIGGVAPQSAIIGAVIGLCIYCLLGDSRFAIMAPTSSSAAIMAAAVVAIPGLDPIHKASMASGLILLTGGLFIAASAARLGQLASFVSRPVLRGFALGLALTITVKQLPIALGLDVHGGDFFQTLKVLAQHMGGINFTSFGIFATALVLLVLLERVPFIPAAFTVLVLGIALSLTADLPLHGVTLVGMIQFSGIGLALPDLVLDQWLQLGETAFALLIIIYAESWGAMRNLALRHGDQIDPNRALLALGVANLVSSLFRGMPVGSGFSASSANEAAGAQTKAAGFFAALSIVIMMAAAGQYFAKLPEPVLAAVVIAALMHSLDPRPLLRLWRIDRDQYLGLATVAAVLAFGILHGMLVAVGLSLIAALRQFAQPQIRILGELDKSRNFVDVIRHPEARETPGVKIIRPDEPLFFANCERVMLAIRQVLDATPAIRIVVLSLEESTDLDSTAIDALMEFQMALAKQGRVLVLARAKDRVRDVLKKAGAGDLSDTGHSFYSVADAAEAAAQLNQPVETPAISIMPMAAR